MSVECFLCALKFITEKEIVAEIVHGRFLSCRTTKIESNGDREICPHHKKIERGNSIVLVYTWNTSIRSCQLQQGYTSHNKDEELKAVTEI